MYWLSFLSGSETPGSKDSDGDADAKLTVGLLKTLKAISMTSAAALDSLASCGAIETVVVVLEVAQVGAVKGDGFTKKLVPRRDELEDQLVPIVYYLCRIDRSRLAQAADVVLQPYWLHVLQDRHLKQFALAILCELCHVAASDNQGDVAAELWRAGGVRLYVRLLDEAYWCVKSTRCSELPGLRPTFQSNLRCLNPIVQSQLCFFFKDWMGRSLNRL